jgi:hypothetical protein
VARQAEVQQHHVFRPAVTKEEIGGLEVAMDDAALVGGGECLSGVAQQGDALLEAQRLA